MVIGFLRLSDVSVICRVVNPRRTSQKIWGGFLYGRSVRRSLVHRGVSADENEVHQF